MNEQGVESKRIHIQGMFCEHCEKRIEDALSRLPGIISVKASYEKEYADVTYTPHEVDMEMIAKCIEDAGYEMTDEENTHLQTTSLLIILIAIWVIANHLGFLQVFNLFPRIETSLTLGAVFFTGVMTSVHCIAMCGGINLTQSVVAATSNQKLFRSNFLYQCGRILSYTVIGAIVGGLGSVIAVSERIKGIITIGAGLAMVFMALNMLGLFRGVRKKLPHTGNFFNAFSGNLLRKSQSSFAIGLLNGLMPCGPLQAMQLYALSTGSAVKGALAMFVFCVGTVPLMLGFGLISGRLNRRFSRVMLTTSALLIFFMSLQMTGNGLALTGIALPQKQSSGVIRAMKEENKQVLVTEIDFGAFPPVQVQAGIPVEWTIVVPEGKLNGCNSEILVPAYGIDATLQEGENLIEFTPLEAETVSYTCWMGMIRSTIEVTQ